MTHMFFNTILEAPADPIFGLRTIFEADTRKEKINLAVGVYQDEHLKTPLMNVVRKAKEKIASQDLVADYLPIDGLSDFCEALGELAFGKTAWEANCNRIAVAQGLGGTGVLQVAGQFLTQEIGRKIAIPHPTWPNHRNIFLRAGMEIDSYPYYNKEGRSVDFDAICLFIKQMEKRSILLLHPVCHNPTGTDLSREQWEELLSLIEEKEIIPFFDFAYHGFGEGLDIDRSTLELFLNRGCEMIVAYSCSKNFSLYNQRVGALFIVTENPIVKLRVQSQVQRVIRSLYSNPPAHGARIVREVLANPHLYQDWVVELEGMRKRMESMRKMLAQLLLTKKAQIDYQYLLKQKGMFAFFDLEKSQVRRLIEEFAIYLPDNGRVAVVGLNET